MAALALSSCAVPIHEQDWYSPIPGDGNGVVLTHFLAEKQELISDQEWYEKILLMQGEGYSLECTFSPVLAEMKKELEELCSKTRCVYMQPTPPKPTKDADALADIPITVLP